MRDRPPRGAGVRAVGTVSGLHGMTGTPGPLPALGYAQMVVRRDGSGRVVVSYEDAVTPPVVFIYGANAHTDARDSALEALAKVLP